MKRLILSVLIMISSINTFAQDSSDESKPIAAVAVIKTISDSFLPGVFEGLTDILSNVEANRRTREELDKAKIKISELESSSENIRMLTVKTLNDLKDYYEAESKDFSTINAFFLKVSIFSTKVHMLVGISDIITNPKVSFGSDDAKIVVINRFKDAARDVVSNFNISEESFVSPNKTINSDVRNHKNTIDAVISRMNGSLLVSPNVTIMSTEQINQYFDLVASIKNEGSHQFSDMEKSVLQIQTLLASFLQDFSAKTIRINNGIEKTIDSMN